MEELRQGVDMGTAEYCKNGTEDNNLTEEEWKYYKTILKWILIGGYVITCILGTIGNGLVIWVAGLKMKKTVYTIWFLNLGVADFVSCIVMPLISVKFILAEHYRFGEIMCKTLPALKFVMYFSFSVSTALITVISVDRCVCILCPVWSTSHRTPRRAMIVSMVVWLLSLIISSPNIYYFYVPRSNNFSHCEVSYANEDYFHKHKAMILTRFISMFIIPFLIIFSCYILMVMWLRKRHFVSNTQRPFRLIAMVVICFFFCWFPFHIKSFIKPCILGKKMFRLFWFTANFLAYVNSCINPIIYVFTYYDFKSTIIKSIPLSLKKAMRDAFTDYVS